MLRRIMQDVASASAATEEKDDDEADLSIHYHICPVLADHNCQRVRMLTPVSLRIAVAVSTSAGAGSADWQRVPRYT